MLSWLYGAVWGLKNDSGGFWRQYAGAEARVGAWVGGWELSISNSIGSRRMQFNVMQLRLGRLWMCCDIVWAIGALLARCVG